VNPRIWNATSEEHTLLLPCDGAVTRSDEVLLRGISVAAPRELVFAWLCQLRVAPYSYDWLDNLGRRSPRTRTPELTVLRGGERFMYIFELISFEPGQHLTLRLLQSSRLLRRCGECALTYCIRDAAPGCRVVAKVVLRYPRGPVGWLMRTVLPWGDFIMMRKQLLTLRSLAEREAAAATASPPL